MKPKQSLLQSEVQDGDIVCFQKVLSKEEYVSTISMLYEQQLTPLLEAKQSRKSTRQPFLNLLFTMITSSTVRKLNSCLSLVPLKHCSLPTTMEYSVSTSPRKTDTTLLQARLRSSFPTSAAVRLIQPISASPQ